MLEFLVIVFGVSLNVILALFVLLNNAKNRTNQLFAATACTFILFSIVNYISISPKYFSQLTWIRADLFIAVMLFMSTFYTFLVFPRARLVRLTKSNVYFGIYSLLVSVLVFTPIVFSDIKIINGHPHPVAAPGIIFFIAQQVVAVLLTVKIVKSKLRTSTPAKHSQLILVAIGSTVALVLIISFNLIAVQIFQNTNFIPLSSIATLFFTSTFAFAIIRRSMFNIRAIVARSVAYILLLLTLASVYAFVIFNLSVLFFSENGVDYSELSTYVLVAMLLAFTFQPLRRFFEKLTDRFLYRDRYDTQELIGHISKILASQIELNILTKKCLDVICDHVKLAHGRLIVLDKQAIYSVVEYGHPPLKLTAGDLSILSKKQKIFDELSDNNTSKHVLQKYDATASVPIKTQNGTIGYLLLGPKQNGSIYSSQDINLLKILGNELGVAIQNAISYEKINDFNKTLQHKVKLATEHLSANNKKLVALDKAKDEFISMASHQLRTPLTTVRGYLAMLLDGNAGKLDKEQLSFLERAYDGSQQIVYLIADMLNVSRASVGKLIFDTKLVDMDKLISNEILQLQHHAESKKVKLSYTKKINRRSEISVDESKIRQVVANFIDNAIFYAPNTTVHIYLETTETELRFMVKDSGIGIPLESQSDLFKKFFRAENAKKIRPDGTGLGLYLAKLVVENQGGKLLFESRENEGSLFGFKFSLG